MSGKTGRQREEDCLVSEETINGLVTNALEAIRSSARIGTLLDHRDLIRILYGWRDFLGNDPSEVRAWTDPLLENARRACRFCGRIDWRNLVTRHGNCGVGRPCADAGVPELRLARVPIFLMSTSFGIGWKLFRKRERLTKRDRKQSTTSLKHGANVVKGGMAHERLPGSCVTTLHI